MTDLKKLAEHESFTLFERGPGSTGDWRNLKLVKAGKAPKNNWWLAWNGERMADNFDQRKLNEHHPDIAQWVVSALTATS